MCDPYARSAFDGPDDVVRYVEVSDETGKGRLARKDAIWSLRTCRLARRAASDDGVGELALSLVRSVVSSWSTFRGSRANPRTMSTVFSSCVVLSLLNDWSLAAWKGVMLVALLRRSRFRYHKHPTMIASSNATPPTTPPATGPATLCEEESLEADAPLGLPEVVGSSSVTFVLSNQIITQSVHNTSKGYDNEIR
jgi:hypothetical protein